MNLDLIPAAEELKSIILDAEKAKKQERGIKVLGEKLRKSGEFGLHEITLYKNYMYKTYLLDVVMLKKVLEQKGYNVSTTKDRFGITDAIVVQW